MTNELETTEQDMLDHSDLGNLVPHFSNKFYIFTGPNISRIYFGDQILNSGEILYHSHITMHTSDLIELRKLIDQLIPNQANS